MERAGVAPRTDDARRRAHTARLLLRARACTGAARERHENEVVRLNLPVALDVARRYRGRGIPDDDLDQVASLGLVKAVRAFDPTLGHDFVSFAVPTVRGELRRHFRDAGWTDTLDARTPGVGGPDPGFDSAEARVALAPLLRSLDDRERTIVALRFLEHRSQTEIGAAVGVSQEQVSRLLAGILARLRRALDALPEETARQVG